MLIASSGQMAEQFLRQKGIFKTFNFCPFCGDKSIGKIRRNFLKCYRCKKEWFPRKDSILEDIRVPLSKFVLAMKLFILEVPENKGYKELGIAYNTAHNVVYQS
jgi:transposase